MKCDAYEQDLIDAAAGGPSSSELEAHLERCLSCRQRRADQQALLAGFEDDLRGRLLAEPSPELLDRVAVRAADAETASRRTWQRGLALAAGLGAVVLAGVLARRPAAITPGPRAATVDTVQGPIRRAAEPETGAPPMRPRPALPTANAARRASPSALNGRSNAREPEVLVPPGQEEALRRFLASLQRGARPVSSLLASATPTEGPVAAPVPIAIAPLDSPANSADPSARSDS